MATVFNGLTDMREKAQQLAEVGATETVRTAVAEITAIVQEVAKRRGEGVTVDYWLRHEASRGEPVDYEIDLADGVTLGFAVVSASGDVLDHYLEIVSPDCRA